MGEKKTQTESQGGGSPPLTGSEIAGEAFNAGFKAALTKVKPEMRCLEVLTVQADAWIEFAKTQSRNDEAERQEPRQ